jgi:P27 family predicted phage terminase small subunit
LYDVTNLSVVSPGNAEPPALPGANDMLSETVEAWDEFWTSPLAGVVIESSDFPSMVRLFELRDEYKRTLSAYRQERVVKGSQGQPVISPLFAAMNGLLKEVRALEDRFGLSPQARLRLSIELGEATDSLDKMNRALMGGDGVESQSPEVIDISDPRTA